MAEQKFYVCEHCGNMVGMIKSSGISMICCGDKMKQLKANTSDGAVEKHLPVISSTPQSDGDTLVTIDIGSVPHPMQPEHYIEWIYLETQKGGQRKVLAAGEAPKAEFLLKDDILVVAYAYCNLHGLWKTEVNQ